MYSFLLSLICFFAALAAHSDTVKDFYQIDIIGFTQPIEENEAIDSQREPPLLIENKKSIPLHYSDNNLLPFKLRPLKTSKLKREHYLLNRQQHYQILFHYSWLQPSDNRRSVRIPMTENKGWKIQGNIRVRQIHYYHINTELYFTSPDDVQPSFVFKNKRRIEEDKLYYLDHPQVGLLVKIHKLEDKNP